MTTRKALWMLIGVSTAVRLAWAASLGGFANEPYYYLYARHLAWGYFDHPPLVGAVAAAGLSLTPDLPMALGLRVGFVLLFAGSTWIMARLTARLFGTQAGLLAALVLNATLYYGVMIGTLAGPDGPLLFFWLLTLDRLTVALADPDRSKPWAWLGVGLVWGVALLSKYHAVLLPAGVVLYLIVHPPARRCLRTPGPYLAVAAGLAVFAPVVAWNAGHGWASLAYQGGRAGKFQGFQLTFLVETLIGQAIYLTPWVGVGLAAVIWRLARRGSRGWSGPEAFLICQAVPALGLFVGVATYRRIMLHWPMIGFVSLMPLLGRAWADRLAEQPRRFGLRLVARAAFPLVLGTLFVIHARTGLFQDSQGRLLGLIPAGKDASVDTIRWDQIARELDRRHLVDSSGTFVFTANWRFSAELAMANPRAALACFHRDARSFNFWSRPEDWVGRDGIFVDVEDGLASPFDYAPWFSRIERIARFPILRAGVAVQRVGLYRCTHLNSPFLFGYRGPGPVPRPWVQPRTPNPSIPPVLVRRRDAVVPR